jgi:hypothetical protein
MDASHENLPIDRPVTVRAVLHVLRTITMPKQTLRALCVPRVGSAREPATRCCGPRRARPFPAQWPGQTGRRVLCCLGRVFGFGPEAWNPKNFLFRFILV